MHYYYCSAPEPRPGHGDTATTAEFVCGRADGEDEGLLRCSRSRRRRLKFLSSTAEKRSHESIRTAAKDWVTSALPDQTSQLFTSSPLTVDGVISCRRLLHVSRPLHPPPPTLHLPSTFITVRPKVSESLPLLVSEKS